VETSTTRSDPSTLGDPPTGDAVAWSVPVGRPVTARPVVAGDVVFLGSGEHDDGADRRSAGLRPRFPGFVHAVGLNGERRFRYAAPAPVLDVAPVAGDDATAPAARRRGAYALCGWYGGPGGVAHRLMRVEAGGPRWRDVPRDANRFVAASTADAVVTGTRDEKVALTGERLTGRDSSGGWRFEVATGDVLAGTGHEGRAYLTVGTRETHCLDARTGDRVWTYPGSAPSWTPRVQGGVVFVARSDRTADGGQPLVALDVDSGRERWRFAGHSDGVFVPVAATNAGTATSDGRTAGEDTGGTAGKPTGRTADGVVYVAGTRGDLWAVDAGRARWHVALDGRVVDGPVVADGVVYVTTTTNVLAAFDAESGDRQWRVRLDRPSRDLGATADGVVVVAATDGAVGGDTYRIRGVARDGRVRFGHDDDEGLLAAFVHGDRAYAVTEAGHLAAYGRDDEID
jgi:outer membrane protein assembly factor BamB